MNLPLLAIYFYYQSFENIRTTGHSAEHILEGGCHGYHSEWIATGNIIHHEAKYESYYVVDQKTYDEKVLTGYKCSCGATK